MMQRNSSAIPRLCTVYARLWNRFWFTPELPQSLGLLRILCGLMLLYTHFVWGLDLRAFLGADGWNGAELLRELQVGAAPTSHFSFWWWIPEAHLATAHWLCLGILLLFTLGVCTRITSVLALVITVSYAHRAMLANFGLDQINTVIVFYLALSRCGDAYSMDRLWTRYRTAYRELQQGRIPAKQVAAPHWTNRLATRLLQFHLCVIYFSAGTAKLQGESWWTGEAVWRVAANFEHQSVDLTWLAHVPWLVNLLTHATVFFEISFGFLIWNRRLRPVILSFGVLLHLGIGMFLGLWPFGLAMVFSYLCFASPVTVRRLLEPVLSLITPRARTLKISRDKRDVLHIAACIKAGDVLDRVALGFLPTDDELALGMSEHATAEQTPQPNLSPLIAICSQLPAKRHSKLIDYLSSYGFSCALVRDLNAARELARSQEPRACVLWFVEGTATQEVWGRGDPFGSSNRIPIIISLQTREQDACRSSSIWKKHIRILTRKANLRQLRTAAEQLLDEACSDMPEQERPDPISSSPKSTSTTSASSPSTSETRRSQSAPGSIAFTGK